jgi:crotonobetainyl-CoA:carnitine CoA-transferase CaiB-like acyl-CoA transferase
MPPLPLPCYQMAYSAGLAAFTALQACLFHEQLHGSSTDAEISALDVAQWVNWKHQLTDISSLYETGMDRADEWRVFPCRDGFVAAIFRDRDMPNVARLAGLPRLAESDFTTNKLRAKNHKEMHALLAESMSRRSKVEILDEAFRLKLPYAEVCTPVQLPTDAQFVARTFIQDWTLRAPIVWQSAPALIEV